MSVNGTHRLGGKKSAIALPITIKKLTFKVYKRHFKLPTNKNGKKKKSLHRKNGQFSKRKIKWPISSILKDVQNTN